MKEEVKVFLRAARNAKGQGSLEYIMMLAAASIVIVIALAMIVEMKHAIVTSIIVNGTNMSISSAISHELAAIASNSV
ncbi:MAG: hypothetical protein ACP5P2_02315 [Candidatus Micrarchaeia archaeon]|jgi:hypothetical protein